MEVRSRFKRTIDSVFARLGFDAQFWFVDGSSPESVRIISRRADQHFELGEAHIHAEDPRLEFRASQIPSPQRGDDIHIDDQIYRIESEPRLEQHRLVWVVDTLRL